MKLFILSLIALTSLGAFAQHTMQDVLLDSQNNRELRKIERQEHIKNFQIIKITDEDCSEIKVDKLNSCNGSWFNSDNLNYTCKLKKPYTQKIFHEKTVETFNISIEPRHVDYKYQSDCQSILSLYL